MAGSSRCRHLASTGLYTKGVPSIGTQSKKDELSQKDPKPTENRKMHNMSHLSFLSSFADLKMGQRQPLAGGHGKQAITSKIIWGFLKMDDHMTQQYHC